MEWSQPSPPPEGTACGTAPSIPPVATASPRACRVACRACTASAPLRRAGVRAPREDPPRLRGREGSLLGEAEVAVKPPELGPGVAGSSTVAAAVAAAERLALTEARASFSIEGEGAATLPADRTPRFWRLLVTKMHCMVFATCPTKGTFFVPACALHEQVPWVTTRRTRHTNAPWQQKQGSTWPSSPRCQHTRHGLPPGSWRGAVQGAGAEACLRLTPASAVCDATHISLPTLLHEMKAQHKQERPCNHLSCHAMNPVGQAARLSGSANGEHGDESIEHNESAQADESERK